MLSSFPEGRNPRAPSCFEVRSVIDHSSTEPVPEPEPKPAPKSVLGDNQAAITPEWMKQLLDHAVAMVSKGKLLTEEERADNADVRTWLFSLIKSWKTHSFSVCCR